MFHLLTRKLIHERNNKASKCVCISRLSFELLGLLNRELILF